jgi:hypothetical protein
MEWAMEHEKAVLGIFLTLNEPSREMQREAAATGFYETVERNFRNCKSSLPPKFSTTQATSAVRLSAAKYSFRASSSWSTVPVT